MSPCLKLTRERKLRRVIIEVDALNIITILGKSRPLNKQKLLTCSHLTLPVLSFLNRHFSWHSLHNSVCKMKAEAIVFGSLTV